MKKLILFVLLLAVFTSCKNESKSSIVTEDSQEQSDIRQLSGNFIYYEDSAVFQTESELFGVIKNEKLEDLIAQSEPLKTELSDEVFTTLKVKVSKNTKNKEVWENWIEIFEIIKVSRINSNDNKIIKLGAESQS